MLKIPEGKFDAYLFDCDGTIADSMPLHLVAWQKALAPWNFEFPEELFYATAGQPVEFIVQVLNEKFGLSMPPKEVTESREAHYLDLLPQIEALPEVLAYIESGTGKIPMAVVSGSPRASVLETLTHLKLLDRFQAVVASGDYKHGKPHPEPFLNAAAKVGVSPERCLVFEDAELGIQSAKAAGMSWVRIPSPMERRALKQK